MSRRNGKVTFGERVKAAAKILSPWSDRRDLSKAIVHLQGASEFPGLIRIDTGTQFRGDRGFRPPTDSNLLALYVSNLWIFATTNIIMRKASTVPEQFKWDDPEDEREIPHDLLALLRHPNPDQTWRRMKEAVFAHMELGGVAYWEKVRDPDNAQVIELRRLQPDTISLEINRKKGITAFIQSSGSGKTVFERDDIVYFDGFDPRSDFGGVPPTLAYWRTAQVDDITREWNRGKLTKGDALDGFIQVPDFLEPEQTDRLTQEWEKKYLQRGKDKKRVAILHGGATFKRLGSNQRDIEYQKQLQMSKEEAFAVTGVPPAFVGDLSRATFNNIYVQRLIFYEDVIDPRLQMFHETLERDLFPEFGADGLQINPDWNAHIFPGEKEERIKIAQGALPKGEGLLERHEARVFAGFDAVPSPPPEASKSDVEKSAPFIFEKRQAILRAEHGENYPMLPVHLHKAARATRKTLEPIMERLVIERMERQAERFLEGTAMEFAKTVAKQAGRDLKAKEKLGKQLDPATVTIFGDMIERMELELRQDMFDEEMAKVYDQQATSATQLASDLMGIAFERPSQDVIQELLEAQNNLIKFVDKTTAEQLLGQLKKGYSKGETEKTLTERLMRTTFGKDNKASRARTIARTELGRASSQAANRVYKKAGAGRRQWSSAVDARDTHIAANGQVRDIDTPFDVGSDQLAFPRDPSGSAEETINCLIGDSRVQVPGTTIAATRRTYTGEAVRITTALGHEVTATPNHPILTNRGWIGAGDLKIGDRIVCRSLREEVGFCDPDIEHVPPTLAEIFGTLHPRCLSERRRSVNMDFHGDGMNGEVDIVWAYGLLGNDNEVAIVEPFHEDDLALTNLRARLLLATSPTRDSLFARSLTASGGAGGFGLSASRLKAHSPISESPSFPDATALDAMFCQDATNRIIGDSKSPHERLDGLPIDVTLDEIVLVETFEFSDHVYNLHTSSGWYIANSIFAKNCRCEEIPVSRFSTATDLELTTQVEFIDASIEKETGESASAFRERQKTSAREAGEEARRVKEELQAAARRRGRGTFGITGLEPVPVGEEGPFPGGA